MFAPSLTSSSSNTTPAPILQYPLPQHPLVYSNEQYHQMMSGQAPQQPPQQSQQQQQPQQFPQQQQQQQQFPQQQQQQQQFSQQLNQNMQDYQYTYAPQPVQNAVSSSTEQQPQQSQEKNQKQQVQAITTQVQNALSIPEDKTQMTLEIYRRILNFNFVGKYDPKLKQIIHQTPHAVLYKFNEETDEWLKLDYQGTLVFYERNINDVDENGNVSERYLTNEELKLKDNYWHGLMILNRNNPKNISLGIIPKKITTKYSDFYQGLNYEIQIQNDLLMLRNTLGDVYGIWIHGEKDRAVFYKFITYAIEG